VQFCLSVLEENGSKAKEESGSG